MFCNRQLFRKKWPSTWKASQKGHTQKISYRGANKHYIRPDTNFFFFPSLCKVLWTPRWHYEMRAKRRRKKRKKKKRRRKKRKPEWFIVVSNTEVANRDNWTKYDTWNSTMCFAHWKLSPFSLFCVMRRGRIHRGSTRHWRCSVLFFMLPYPK